MIIQPKVRGFICITAHPEGCASNVQTQIDYVLSKTELKKSPKKILIIGASTGYGLASRIVSVFGAKADTFGVFYERPGELNKPASPGWYNTIALESAAEKIGVKFYSMNGDAFSADFKQKILKSLKETIGSVDLVIYSLAAPRRTDSEGKTYKSVIKPVNQSFTSKSVNTDTGEVFDVTIDPASDSELFDTIKVMGGEDWKDWIRLLLDKNLLNKNVTTVAYSYIGPEVTWPIYRSGTIGQAKQHLEKTAEEVNDILKKNLNGHALISVNKAVVTQASSAIPVVPLYTSILFKVMKEQGLHEDCIQQIYRLFEGLFEGTGFLKSDSNTRVRLDNLELKDSVQLEILKIWREINTKNLRKISDFDGYQKNFLQLFGFEQSNIDYTKDVDPVRTMNHLLL